MSKFTDTELEKLWESLENVPFYSIESANPVIMYLDVKWHIFEKHTSRDEIWEWFNERHSRGISYLLYEYVFERDR